MAVYYNIVINSNFFFIIIIIVNDFNTEAILFTYLIFEEFYF